MPPGGDGFYYFSTYLVTDDGEVAVFFITVAGVGNGTPHGDSSTGGEYGTATGSIVVYLTEGKNHFRVILKCSFIRSLIRVSSVIKSLFL